MLFFLLSLIYIYKTWDSKILPNESKQNYEDFIVLNVRLPQLVSLNFLVMSLSLSIISELGSEPCCWNK